MTKTPFHSNSNDAVLFDPFHTPWIYRRWHDRIIQAPAPATSRVYGTEITGGQCAIYIGAGNHEDFNKAYGVVKFDGRLILLHRYAFMCHHEIQLTSLDIVDHLCRVRRCFNPYHHECTTPLENYERGDGPLYRFRALQDKMRERMEEIPF